MTSSPVSFTELGSPDSNQLNRAGDEVFLPCKHTTDHTPPDCTSISWLFSAYENQRTVNLVTSGDVIDKNKYSLSKNCSLVMKEVREGDVGRYGCRRNPQNDYVIRLFVVNSESTSAGGGMGQLSSNSFNCDRKSKNRNTEHRAALVHTSSEGATKVANSFRL